jgi:hypothetical protein
MIMIGSWIGVESDDAALTNCLVAPSEDLADRCSSALDGLIDWPRSEADSKDHLKTVEIHVAIVAALDVPAENEPFSGVHEGQGRASGAATIVEPISGGASLGYVDQEPRRFGVRSQRICVRKRPRSDPATDGQTVSRR